MFDQFTLRIETRLPWANAGKQSLDQKPGRIETFSLLADAMSPGLKPRKRPESSIRYWDMGWRTCTVLNASIFTMMLFRSTCSSPARYARSASRVVRNAFGGCCAS